MKKEKRKISKLKLWDKNPRTITEENFERLKKQIKKLGEYKPLIITPDGTVIGGNMRLRAFRELGFDEVWVSVVKAKTEAKKLEYALSDNDRVGAYHEDELANLIGSFEDDIDLGDFNLDLGEPENLQDVINDLTEKEEFKEEVVNKNIKDIKILNLYAGIGGNRRFWGDLDITAIEYNEKIAKVYQDYFPNDEVIITDAHDYLEEHFNEYDFIWSSPPCPTHSKLRKNLSITTGAKPIYPDLKLYEEILFLQGYFKGKWVIENVISWYNPLIKPQKIERHYYWANFNININKINKYNIKENIEVFNKSNNKKKWGFDLNKYSFDSDYPAQKILNNMVHPKTGKYILECAYKK